MPIYDFLVAARAPILALGRERATLEIADARLAVLLPAAFRTSNRVTRTIAHDRRRARHLDGDAAFSPLT